MLPGVDVSTWNGPPADWRGIAGSIDWAAVKICELSSGGAYVSPDAAADLAALKSAGKGRVCYLFGHPAMSVAATVRLFGDELGRLGLDDGDGVMLDLETTDGLSPAAVNLWALDVLRALESEHDRPPLLYTFLSFAEAGNCASLERFPLYIADPSASSGHPVVPAPWKSWAIQQTSISSPLDRDVANYPDLAAMRAALGKRKPAPAPESGKPGKAIHWHMLGVRRSLDWEAARHHTTPQEMLDLAKAAGHRYGPAMAEYIARGDWAAPIPEGTQLYAPER
jgi:lysozyme